jgi:LDH2 family malate/lactate/ureidoglycolate dehydrogenase
MKLPLQKVRETTKKLLEGAGLSAADAVIVTDVFMSATLRGNNHHDLHDLPGRLNSLKTDKVNRSPRITLIHKNKAMENYEGDNGLGELHGAFIAKRSVELAKEFGVGICAIRNSNHLLACAPFCEIIAEAGMLGYVLTRGAPTMGAPGRVEKVIGTTPQGFAAPKKDGTRLVFDACLAYAANSLLNEYVRNHKTMPSHWCLDKNGNPATDPKEVLDGGIRQPIGAHKGFGLTILGEILTGILSEGQIIDEPQKETGIAGQPSHTAVCLDIGGLIGPDIFPERISEMITRMKKRADNLKIPNERADEFKHKILADQSMDIDDALVFKLNAWCDQLAIPQLGLQERV